MYLIDNQVTDASTRMLLVFAFPYTINSGTHLAHYDLLRLDEAFEEIPKLVMSDYPVFCHV
jgi:hypothetical protein